MPSNKSYYGLRTPTRLLHKPLRRLYSEPGNVRLELHMMKAILLVVTIATVPTVSSAQMLSDMSICTQLDSFGADGSGLREVSWDKISDELDRELSEFPAAVVCITDTSKSPGHGLLGIEWDKRGTIELRIFRTGRERYFIDGIRVTQLKSPIGKWRIPEGETALVYSKESKGNLYESISDAYKNLTEGDLDVNSTLRFGSLRK